MSESTAQHTDLSKKDLEEIRKAASEIMEIEKVVLFGSRALHTAKHGSDIDLAIMGKGITHATKLHFHDTLNEETDIPLFIDVVDYNTIQNKDLKSHIDKNGIVIFNKHQ